jgi:hypothetical protein
MDPYQKDVLFAVVAAILALLMALAFPAGAHAAPYLVTDPVDDNADACVYQVGTAAPQIFPVVTEQGKRLCKIDLANAAEGTNNITLRVRNTLWGKESASVPFSFTRPATVSAPANMRLVP